MRLGPCQADLMQTPSRTATAGDPLGPRNLLILVSVVGAGYIVYRRATGRRVPPLALASATLTLIAFLKK
jgi:hypothetical protein